MLGGYFANSLQEGVARDNFSGLNIARCVHLHLNDNFAAGMCRYSYLWISCGSNRGYDSRTVASRLAVNSDYHRSGSQRSYYQKP